MHTKIQQQQRHLDTIEHLKEKYRLSEQELNQLEDVKAYHINSIAFTTEGGFNCETGEFSANPDSESYKIRILYNDSLSENERIMCLKQEPYKKYPRG